MIDEMKKFLFIPVFLFFLLPVFSDVVVTKPGGAAAAGGGGATTEAELESDLTDVTNVWTNNDVADVEEETHATEHETGGGDAVNHDSLDGFVAAEHVDHSGVTLTAGTGISGGGTIESNRTFDLDISELTTDSGITTGDFIPYRDTTEGADNKVLFESLFGSNIRSLGGTVDGGGSTIPTGTVGYTYVPYDISLSSIVAMADTDGSAVVDVWVDTAAAFDAGTLDNSDSITNGNELTISGDNYSLNNLSGWSSTTISAGSVVAFNVDSATTITELNFILYGTSTGVGLTQENVVNVQKGLVSWLGVDYSDTTEVKIQPGYGEANGKFFEITAETDYTFTSLASGSDWHWLYIENTSLSSGDATPSFTDSTTAPVWSDSKQGYYNGNDRAIGFFHSTDGAATLTVFEVIMTGNRYEYNYGRTGVLGSNMAPDGTWQSPTTAATAVGPDLYDALLLWLGNTDTSGDRVKVSFTSSEMAAVQTNTTLGAQYLGFTQTASGLESDIQGWVIVGDSREIKWSSEDNDDDSADLYIMGAALNL